VETTYGFSRTDPGAALAAANELSRRYREGSIRRVNADGSVDLVGVDGLFLRPRRFHRYRIDTYGTSVLEEDTPVPSEYTFWVVVLIAGVAAFFAAGLSVIATGNTDLASLLVLGFAAALVGAVKANHFDVKWFVRERFGTDEDWQQIYAPLTWVPRTAAQLRRVESLTEDHGGQAYVRALHDGTAEVATMRRGHFHHFRVFHDGAFALLHGERAYGHAAAAVTLVGGIIASVALKQRFDLSAGTFSAMFFGFTVAASVIGHRHSLKNRIEKRNPGEWHLVRTRPEDSG
jgi:hypothetical protein